MVVSAAHWTRSTAARQVGVPRSRRPIRRHVTAIRGPVRTASRTAEWVPVRGSSTMTVARFLRLFADDQKFTRLKVLMLAALVIAAAVLDRVV
jgi:hypothetical protein